MLTASSLSTYPYYAPQGLALQIFQGRYTLHEHEVWTEGCDRVANHVAGAENNGDVIRYRAEFSEILKKNLFMPGGRIWYGSGRPKGQLLNCFVVPTSDSREGWGKTFYDETVICGTGGGLGINFSPVRPRGSLIHGHKGPATGAVSEMMAVDAIGTVLKAGGGRRTALMFTLSLTHGDILEFLDKKLDLKELNNANVSVWFDENPERFFEQIRRDEEIELKFGGKIVGRISAKKIWAKIIGNALKAGEPGLLNGHLFNKMSNIWYHSPIICTNPCFAPGTLIQTRAGHFPIESLVGKRVGVWDGNAWVMIDNFRVTGENQPVVSIEMQDGSSETVTPYHTCILENGTRIQAKDLVPGMRLAISTAPQSHGDVKASGAYLKGFLVGDRSRTEERAILSLYSTKYSCMGRLIESAMECPVRDVNTNAISTLGFNPATEKNPDRRGMTGLSVRPELSPWANQYKKSLPTEIFAWDLHSKLEFIAGVMDADGTASDTVNGWMYQICSIHRPWLAQFQTLLKTVGVRSKLSIMKEAGKKDFGDGYGEYESKACWRLTVSQEPSIVLAKQVRFSRLASFANKTTTYKMKSRANKIVSITDAGIEERVYCCTVDSTHSLSLSSGNHWGQCGEIGLCAYDCCCLGAVVLSRFVQDGEIDWATLKAVVALGIRFLDDVLSVNNYPLPEIREVCHNIRRIGLGVMGLHDMLLMMGLKYSSPAGLEMVDKVMKFIKSESYLASIELAKEKGAFPAFDAEKFLKGGFAKTLKPSIRAAIKEHGIRNCAVNTIAPTGTTAMVCGCSSGIEPLYSPAAIRTFFEGDTLKQEVVIHPLFKEYVEAGKSVKHFQGAYDLKLRDHFEMQRVCQKHLDNACSKTINVMPGTSEEELSDLYMEFFPELKGVTVYPEGSRENQPLKPISLEEAKEYVKGKISLETLSLDSCKDGKCDI